MLGEISALHALTRILANKRRKLVRMPVSSVMIWSGGSGSYVSMASVEQGSHTIPILSMGGYVLGNLHGFHVDSVVPTNRGASKG